MLPTFDKADIRTDGDGQRFLDLDIRIIADGQTFIIKYTFPATSNFQNPNKKESDRSE